VCVGGAVHVELLGFEGGDPMILPEDFHLKNCNGQLIVMSVHF